MFCKTLISKKGLFMGYEIFAKIYPFWWTNCWSFSRGFLRKWNVLKIACNCDWKQNHLQKRNPSPLPAKVALQTPAPRRLPRVQLEADNLAENQKGTRILELKPEWLFMISVPVHKYRIWCMKFPYIPESNLNAVGFKKDIFRNLTCLFKNV